MKKNTWIVIANSSVARIFEVENHTSLKELNQLIHPESRQHSRDLVSDRPGRGFESVGPARHNMEPKTNPQDQEIIDFAKKLCSHLDAARSKGTINRIYIAANPHFLGLIRKHLPAQTAQLIAAEVDKDITTLKPQEILEYFTISTL